MINGYLVFALLVVFQFKHYLADYPMQGKYMLGKFLPDWRFVKPLTAHCLVHAAMTLAILLAFNRGDLWVWAFFDFACHFIMDRLKAGPKYLGRYKALSGAEYMPLMKELADIEHSKLKTIEMIERRVKIENSFESNVLFWWSLGVDQGVHHLTHYVVIWMMVH